MEPGGNRNRYWNASSACCNFNETETDDSGYVRRIIDQIKASYNVDDGLSETPALVNTY